MAPACCERCGSTGAVRVAGRVWLCRTCIRCALEVQFPIFGVPLALLAAALRPEEEARRASGGR